MNHEEKQRLSRIALGLLCGGAGVAHFTNHEFFGQLIPGSLDKYRTRSIGAPVPSEWSARSASWCPSAGRRPLEHHRPPGTELP